MLFWHMGATAGIVFVTLGRRRIDYRVVLLGAILPDLIDKPLGRIFFEDTFQTSRLFAHTLLFVVVTLLAVQLILRGDSARRWFILPIACLLHLVLDGLWGDPVTLFWPLFGTTFPPHPVESYWLEVLRRPLEHPLVMVQEIFGLSVLLYIAWAYRLFRMTGLREFARSGKLVDPKTK